MRNSRLVLMYLVITVALFSSCQKYEDGPLISFRSKTERIANNWRVAKAIHDGNDVTGDFNRYDISLSKNGDASLTATYSFLGADYDYKTTGKWSLVEDKEKIVLDFENNLADANYFILRLKEKELWVRQENSNLELHLEPK